VDVPEVSSEITSTNLVSDMHFVVLHCLTGCHTSLQIMLLKKQFRGCQFHNNEEVEMAIRERSIYKYLFTSIHNNIPQLCIDMNKYLYIFLLRHTMGWPY